MYQTKYYTIKYTKTLLAICAVFAFASTFLLSQPTTVRASTNVNFATSTDGANGEMGRTSSYIKLAQGFTMPASNLSVTSFTACIQNMGSPTDGTYVTINTHDSVNDVPSTTVLATSNTNAYTTNATCSPQNVWTFPTQVELTASTQYWFVIQRTGPTDDSNYYRFRLHSSGGYSGGRYSRLNSGSYTDFSTGLTSYDMQGSFQYDTFIPPSGCTYTEATNYDADAVTDDGSCIFPDPVVPTEAEEYYAQAIKDMYQTKLFYGLISFLIMMFGFMFYFLIKYKK